MPYYKSATGKNITIKLGKNKTEILITPNPKFFSQETLDVLFPKHIIKTEENIIPIKKENLDNYIKKEIIRQTPQLFKEYFLQNSLPTGSWKNQRCFIIGGGPSLEGFNFKQLKNEKIIAINKAFVDVPFAEIQFAVDRQFQDWILDPEKGGEKMSKAHAFWSNFKGHKVWLKMPGNIYKNGIEFVNLAGHEGISTSLEEGIYDGSNSGYAAINLAIALGANPIYLLGYDMKHKGKKSHYHEGYPKPQTDNQLKLFSKKFPKLAKLAEEKGIKIINLNKDSALKCFEFESIEKALFTSVPLQKKYIIVSFYTPEYTNDILRLTKSVKRFNLPYDFELLKNLPLEGKDKYKNWSKNAYQKAEFIKKMMNKYPNKDIVWIDADAEIQQYPTLFDNISNFTIACHYRNNIELLTGTLYVRNDDFGKKIIDEWIIENKNSNNFLEQKNLETIIKKYPTKIYKLPDTYCKIFDIMKETINPVIEHFQSSRQWRKAGEKQKKISVVMPTYNQGKFIQESIDSVLNQTFENFELIIVDDGSTDNTKEILNNQIDKRIKIIYKENGGTGSALNLGFEQATGEYETWLASDNKYYPNALQDMFDILETKKDVDFVYCNCEIGVMDSTGLGEITRKNYNSEVPMEWDSHKFYEHHNIGVIWLWRKELRLVAGTHFITEPCEDYEMTIRMIEAAGRFYYHPVVSGWHRRHNANLTKKLLTSGQYIQNLVKNMKQRRDKKTKTESVFTEIYKGNKWHGKESRSGQGSSLESTKKIREEIPKLFEKYNIKTIIDAACGDWNWMNHLIKEIEFDNYKGIDVVEEIIEKNINTYSNEKINFHNANLITQPLNYKADVIFCRDMLNHLSNFDVLEVLKNFIQSESTYILMTNFTKNRPNSDIKTGNWRPINFQMEPFSFPTPIESINEECDVLDTTGSYEDKEIALWKLADLIDYISNFIKKIDYKKIKINNAVFESIDIQKLQLKEQELQLKEQENKPNLSEWCLKKIPKRAYFYWGNKTLPYLRYLTVYSFCKMNSDWEVILYYPKKITETNTWISTEHCYEINCSDYFEELKKLPITLKEFDGRDIGIPNEYPEVFKSDFLRWHLLGQYGGVWLDMDIVFNKSMNNLNLNTFKNKDLDTIVSISNVPTLSTFHSIGVMASSPKNAYYRYIMSKALKIKPDFTNYQSIGVVLLNTEFPTVESIRKKFPNLIIDTIAFDTVYAYYPMKLIENIFTPFSPNRLAPHSLGIHWYAGHPMAGEFTNKLTSENYKDFITTPIGKLICEVLKT